MNQREPITKDDLISRGFALMSRERVAPDSDLLRFQKADIHVYLILDFFTQEPTEASVIRGVDPTPFTLSKINGELVYFKPVTLL